MTDGDAEYKPFCDIGIPIDYTIDLLDMKVFLGNWMVGFE